METSTVVNVPPPQYKVIAELIAGILLTAKEAGAEQETVRTALETFAHAVASNPQR